MPNPNRAVEAVARAIRDKIKVDATGLAPALASALVVGIDEAALAAIRALAENIDAGMVEAALGSVNYYKGADLGRIDADDARDALKAALLAAAGEVE